MASSKGDPGYLNMLRELDDDDLRLVAAQVEQMTQHPGWVAVMDLMDRAVANAYKRLEGTAFNEYKILDQAQYTRLLGVIAGLKQPQIAADSFAAALEKLRERDNESPE